jgi:hypothetical protein
LVFKEPGYLSVIAAEYGLDDRMIGIRIPVGGWKFFSSTPHLDCFWGHPASYPTGTRGSFLGSKAGEA